MSNLSTHEPAPIPNSNPAVWDLVVQDIKERDEYGEQHYGTRLQPFNGRNALKDAYQEALDLVVYLRQKIYEEDQYIRVAEVVDESGHHYLIPYELVEEFDSYEDIDWEDYDRQDEFIEKFEKFMCNGACREYIMLAKRNEVFSDSTTE